MTNLIMISLLTSYLDIQTKLNAKQQNMPQKCARMHTLNKISAILLARTKQEGYFCDDTMLKFCGYVVADSFVNQK